MGYVIDAIHADAGGNIFFHDMSPEILLQSFHRVVEGGTQMTTSLLHTAVENLLQNGRKTPAEHTAEAAHLSDSNETISAALGIALNTTKKHVRKGIDKMQARSRTHAAIIAAQAGLVGNPVTVVHETLLNRN